MKFLLSTLAAACALLCFGCTGTSLPTAPSAAATINPFSLAEGLDLTFFRAFVQNGYESPDRLEPIRRLPGPIRFYLRTHDSAGRQIDAVTLDATERILVESVGPWSGGRFGTTEVLRGTGTREKVAGWLTVKWSNVTTSGTCGRSTVGVDGGFIEFNHLAECNCGNASRIYPRLVRHELGHAMGFYHTDREDDVMYGRAIQPDSCDLQPSERERRHALYTYVTQTQ